MSIMSDTDASNIAHQYCAINLQVLSSLLNSDSVWAFSLANDASTHREKSYFDNRIRFCLDGNLYNFHAISIPMFSRHTVEYMYNLVARFLDVLSPVWRSKLIGLSSDGAPVMTGEYNGVITQ